MSNPFVLAVMRAMRGKLPKANPKETRAPDKEPEAARPRSNSNDSTQNDTRKSEAQD